MRSRTHPRPLFDLALLANRSYSIGNLGSVFFVVGFFAWLVVFPEFIQRTWGWSVLKTGFAIAPGPMVATVLSPITGRLADSPRAFLDGIQNVWRFAVLLWILQALTFAFVFPRNTTATHT